MQRIHTTNKKAIRIPYSVPYIQELSWKPIGMWYGIDWSWHEWCKSESFGGRGKNDFELELDMKNILVLNSVDKIRQFAETFGEYPEWMKNRPYFDGKPKDKYIDWKKVSQMYSGIEISPYQWKCRHEFMFYYGWDVASGCVWNLNAVKSVTQIEKSKTISV